jgi:hypothetical protein
VRALRLQKNEGENNSPMVGTGSGQNFKKFRWWFFKYFVDIRIAVGGLQGRGFDAFKHVKTGVEDTFSAENLEKEKDR